jgi:ZIP family zinc transporter/zinc and cadmium transporter
MTAHLLPLVAAALAASATVLGGTLVLLKRNWEEHVLKYSISFGAGFMLGAAALAMLPASFQLTSQAPVFLLIGYLTIHFFEHTIVPHFHFGEETHSDQLVNPLVSFSSLFGLSIHNVFDGISIGAGFLVSPMLGLLIFGAVMLHKIPDGFTMASIMLASGRSGKQAFGSAVILGISTLAGALFIGFFEEIVHYALPFSAGVTFYIAATDLMPIINESRRLRYSFAFFAGILVFYLSELILSYYVKGA